MISSELQNDFLVSLLALQQDGKFAISAPANWATNEPLLEVATDVDVIIRELCDAILIGENNNDTARWHFFIGSPGNGKSAAMGKLCKQLIGEKGCQVRDESGVPLSELEPTAIPYAINIYENSNRFTSAQIVQDASVVRNPFSPKVDPAKELLDTLRHAWDKGISLVVCTNRGVLEKAHRDNHMNRDINSAPWFKVVADIVSADVSLLGQTNDIREFECKNPVFHHVKVGYSHLDNRSLLLGRSTFANLIQKAVTETNWVACASCSSHGMCPFKANRDWLDDGTGQNKILRLLTRAEVLSGQVIVFREALAIISLLLAGCPKDYDGIHPCDWVRTKVASGDVFSLVTRRLYMSLFASYCPYGLESVDELRNRQLKAFRGLIAAIDATSFQSYNAVRHIVEGHSPSTDVGVTRLLGENGIISNLDPCVEAIPSEFYDNWDVGFDVVLDGEPQYVSDLERSVLSIFKEMEEGLELLADYSISEGYWALRRWSSNFLLHLGALVEGRTAWAQDLDKFGDLLELVKKPVCERTIDDKRAIRQLDTRLENLFNVAMGDHSSSAVPLSEAVTLTGQWVREKLKLKTQGSQASGSVSLTIQFEGGEQAVFNANMFLWLTRKDEGKLDNRCFPQELIAGVKDARIRAAAKGQYAFENNDVELVINTGKKEQFRLTRVDGDVDVTE